MPTHARRRWRGAGWRAAASIQSQRRKKSERVPTFGELADEIAGHLAEGFRNAKHKAQWRMTLTVYAEPLRAKPVDKIETADVLAVSATNLAGEARDGFTSPRAHRAHPQRRQGQGLSDGREPRRVARTP